MNLKLYSLLTLLICSTAIFSQGTYLQGDHLEMVVSNDGYYFDNFSVPPGFHPNTFSGFGLVSDVNRSGWADDGTALPDYCGDFIAPGSPVESFAVQIGTTVLANASNAFTPPDIPGSVTAFSNGPGQLRYAIWEGGASGLDLRQTTVFFENRQYVFTVVDMCNTTGADIGPVWYGRNWDPDNDQPWAGSFLTEHEIVSQPSFINQYASVKSEGTTFGCYQETIAEDFRARASYGGFLIGVPADMWNGVLPYSNTNGSSRIADEANQMTYSLGVLAGGDCTCFSFVTVYQEVERASAVARLPMACSEVAALLADPAKADLTNFMNPENEPKARLAVADELTVYPNPATNFATVDLTDEIDTEVTIRLINVAGQVVFEQRKVVTGTQQHLPVQDLPAGLYTLQVDSDSVIKSTRLVVN